MAAGYGTSGSGTITNNGTINVNGVGGSIGMYGTGANTRVINGATGTINLGANEAILIMVRQVKILVKSLQLVQGHIQR